MFRIIRQRLTHPLHREVLEEQKKQLHQKFSEMTQNALKILKYANTMEVYELMDARKSLSDDKAEYQRLSGYFPVLVQRCPDV